VKPLRDPRFRGSVRPVRKPYAAPGPALATVRRMAVVDVVIVSYNSRERVGPLVRRLAAAAELHVVVVDNASSDGSLDALEGLDATAVALDRNYGFAYGCNRGIERGGAPYVLLLNPDTQADRDSVLGLATALERRAEAGAVAPRIVDSRGRRSRGRSFSIASSRGRRGSTR
jgi:GT2 family glycosyltransferase